LSWKVADQLLIEKHDLQSCCFAAQTMRNKIQNSFHELPESAHESLRESLISHIGHITVETRPVIVTQLCLALADLALLMSSWKKPVVSLLERFSRDPNAMFSMVELLTLIPEEINSRYLRLGANRRKEILSELESNSSVVGEYLVACLMNCNDNENLQMKILKCLTSWIQINAFKLTELTDNMILAYAFQLLTNLQTKAELHDAATDCLCSLLNCLESTNDVTGLETKIFNGVLSLEDAYNASVRHEDIDKSMNFSRLFTVLVESFLPKMIANSCNNSPHYTMKAFDLVLNCVGHYDFEVAEITFSMWYKLSEDLYNRNNDQLSIHFKPYVEKLIAALYKHCQMDPDHEGLIDEGDSFKVN
jgi:transportin-3